MDETGCLAFNDPYGFVDCAAQIDLPVSRDLLIKQLPLILRAQRSDGGWGEKSHKVLGALMKHDLLEPLRERPPLPAVWEVVRSIPAPDGELYGLLWDGHRLWVGERTSNEVIAL